MAVRKWDVPRMVVKADDRKRVVLPGAKPGDCFDVQVFGEEFRLVRLQKPKPNKARLVKGPDGYLLIQTDRPVTHEEIRKLLDDFP